MRAHPAAELFPLLGDAELKELAADIKANGLRLPIMTVDGKILDGRNRFAACKLAGVEPKFQEYRGSNPVAFVVSVNIKRRHLDAGQRTLVILRAEALTATLAIEAKARQGTRTDLGQHVGQSGRTDEQLARMASVSDETIRHGRKVLAAATPAVVAAVDRGVLAVTAAASLATRAVAEQIAVVEKVQRGEARNATEAVRQLKEAERETRRVENRALVEQAADPAALEAIYSTIVIDPPWDWGDEGDVDQLGRARPTYSTMSFEELLEFPVVPRAAAKDCHLYLWITNRSLPKGFALMERWGFRYVTCLTWCKPSIGMGNYYRGSTEQVLFGVRGSLPLKRRDVGTWFAANRPGLHSAKPDEFYRLIESCSPGPYLDVFARSGRPGWVCYGAEAPRAA